MIKKSLIILVDNLNFISETYSNEELKNIEAKDNLLAPVNNLQSLAKSFIRQHGSYNKDNLQDWMNLLWFILNKPYDKYAKVLRFVELTLNSPTRVKNRDAMNAKAPK